MFANVHQFLIEFSSSSTVHGVNYFGDRRRHWSERVFWIIVFLVSMSACCYTVHKTYTKWQSSPIIVTQDDKLTAISEIPFPAITICPAAKVKPGLPFNLTRIRNDLTRAAFKRLMSGVMSPSNTLINFEINDDELKALQLTREELVLLDAVSHICPPTISTVAVDFTEDSLNPSANVADTLKLYALRWYDILSRRLLKGAHKPDLFERVLTEEGLCYTFNGLRNFDIFKESIADDFRPYESTMNGIDWNSEDGYKRTKDKEIIPRRAFNSNPRDGLRMTLLQDTDVSATGCPITSDNNNERLKVVIHSPADFPRVGHKFISVPFSEELVISVKPVMMTTSPELARYSVGTRQCYFNSDRSLKFFKYYSQSNCEFECLTNFTFLACDCVRVTMPRDNLTRICKHEDRYCVNRGVYIFHMKSMDDMDVKVKDFKTDFEFSDEKMELLMQHSCDCLPSCVSLNYDVTTTQFALDDRHRIEVYPESRESNVMVYFEDATFLKTKRSEIYGWGDFIANCGGLLGLFMGVSILSIIEIIYFATLRLACTLKVSDNRITTIESAVENTATPVFQRTFHLELVDWDRNRF